MVWSSVTFQFQELNCSWVRAEYFLERTCPRPYQTQSKQNNLHSASSQAKRTSQAKSAMIFHGPELLPGQICRVCAASFLPCSWLSIFLLNSGRGGSGSCYSLFMGSVLGTSASLGPGEVSFPVLPPVLPASSMSVAALCLACPGTWRRLLFLTHSIFRALPTSDPNPHEISRIPSINLLWALDHILYSTGKERQTTAQSLLLPLWPASAVGLLTDKWKHGKHRFFYNIECEGCDQRWDLQKIPPCQTE